MRNFIKKFQFAISAKCSERQEFIGLGVCGEVSYEAMLRLQRDFAYQCFMPVTKLLFVFLFLVLLQLQLTAQNNGSPPLKILPVFEQTLLLETTSERSANVAFGDLNADGNLDIVLAKGRHWPLVNRVLLGDGKGGVTKAYDLAPATSRSYSGRIADMDADGDLDIVVSNDKPDSNLVYLNDGSGSFSVGSAFGKADWPTRNASVVDLNQDGLPDIVVANRGRGEAGKSYICINQGGGKFDNEGIVLSTYGSTTITPADFNNDGMIDLAVPHRNGGQSYVFLQTESSGLKFKQVPFGTAEAAIRMSQAADLNGNGRMDLVTIDTKRGVLIHHQQSDGVFSPAKFLGEQNTKPYALEVGDLNLDGLTDIVVGYVEAPSVVYFNAGAGKGYLPRVFGDGLGAVYGFGIADFNKDDFPDIAAARSGAPNVLYFGSAVDTQDRQNWPSFRGPSATGIADGFPTRRSWNADSTAGEIKGVLWRAEIPGLGHSSPIVFGDRIYVASAISEQGDAPLMVGRGGKSTAASDSGKQSWVVFCYNKKTGKEIWRRTARQGEPQASRHMKATHANTSLATDGKSLVAFFGSEGLYCYDLDGKLLWEKDLGVINISKYGIGWGYSSSPVVHDGRIALVCDDPANPFVVVLQLSDGKELWRVSRKDICERSWGTPLIHSSKQKTQLIINGWPWVVSYDLESGEEIWKIRGGGDNPVPTPFEANGWIYVTNAHGGKSPIYVIRPEATGDITPSIEAPANEGIVWSVERGGSYLSTPVVYGEYLYLGNTNGSVRCFNAITGEMLFQERLDIGAGIISSLVAADGKIYCASENGKVYVLAAGPEFKLLSRNEMGEPCFATPAISEGVVYFRTTGSLVAIK
ncbi:MAG: FG-GAP-like repeat-containing protein [Calditrichia bacterium]